jgi:putative selenium metabolism hydrolase
MRFLQLAQESQAELVLATQQAVRLASPPGEEEALAHYMHGEMLRLGYDEAWIDEAGNVIGRVRGQGGRSLMLHAHMDIVETGDPGLWRYPPFSGELADGCLWGRGAVDDKGCLIAQLYAGALLKRAGIPLAGDLYVVGVVHEEDGGMGTRHLLRHLRPAIAVIGEPSACTLRRGHRGRYEWVVRFAGRSVHASVPQMGLNPLFSLARFLLGLRELPMFAEPVFGGSSVAPTLCSVNQESSNVIPGLATVHLDWRTAPGETEAHARTILGSLLERCVEPGVSAELSLRHHAARSFTGLEMDVERSLQGYLVAPDAPVLLAANEALAQALDHPVATDVWHFCTDGGYIAAESIPCVGFGPGDPAMAHVCDERLPVGQLVEGVAGYMALASRLTELNG